MRVAVRHTDEEHPNAHWFAYGGLGRILGFQDPISGQSYTPEEVADALLGRAKQDFPEDAGYEHRLETLHTTGQDEAGNEVGDWFPAGESDLPRAGQGETRQHELTATQGQEESAE